MRVVLVNPVHTAIGSRVPKEHLPPLGLLYLGGPLGDAGHDVVLVNADRQDLSLDDTLRAIAKEKPDAILIGHSGSSSAHPTIQKIIRGARSACPNAHIIYGGVYPTYHWKEVLDDLPELDVIVRGEGEATIVALLAALEHQSPLSQVHGIAFRRDGQPYATAPAPMIRDLDENRIGWELIDFDDYSYWGGKKSVILQFSRGCPHLCTYCGQRGFWTKWRHRDPVKFAKEIAWLHREHGVELINLADENPTSSRRQWKAFLEALIAEDVDVTLVGSTRAGDIVRDRDILHLYKKAGVIRFLLGIEALDAGTLERIGKGSAPATDQEAIRLLREHGMIGLCTFAVGFEEETDQDYLTLLKQLLRYDPDQIMSVYATPHRWTPFYENSRHRRVIQRDFRLWDYKHQVIETTKVPAWRVFFWVKAIEAILQLRPKAIWRTYFHTDPDIRHAMRWYSRMGRRVVLREVWQFLFKERRKAGVTVAEFMGGASTFAEDALARPRKAG